MMHLLRRDIEYKDFDDFDDLVITVLALENIREGYKRKDLDVPQWLTEKITAGNAELSYRTRARKERRLEELKLEEHSLKTRKERRDEVSEERRKLEEELA